MAMTTYSEAVEQTITAGEQIHQIVNGTATTEVTVADGSTIPSIRKAQVDSMYFKEPEAWTTGQTETDYLQLKKYTHPTTGKESWWFAKGALVSNPIAMGTSPFGDDNWTLYTPEDLFISGKAEYESVYQALKGKAAEAGYNLVAGSFEEGGTLTNTNDVLWYQSNGRYYSWKGSLPKVVPAGSTPATSGGISSGAWVDRTNLTLRNEINIIVKRFNSVAELIADTSLSIGMIVETLGYYQTVESAKGGNCYEIVAAGTGTEDGGRYIALSNGLLARGLFKDGVVSAERFGAKGDGSTDDTAAFQKAIDSFGNGTSYDTSIDGLKVNFGSGVFNITNLIVKSGVSLIGAGRWVSRIKAIGTGGWTIQTTAFSGGTRSFETSLKGFSINGNSAMGIISDPLVVRPTVGGIGLYSSVGLRIDDVSVYFLDGIGIGNYTNQDVGFTNVDVLHCDRGVDFGQYDNDIANAVHAFGLRIENCTTYLMRIEGGSNQVRDINFTACKFERGKIFIKEASGIMFSACSIISQIAAEAMVQVSPGVLSDTRCITFDGCYFTSGLTRTARAISATTGTHPVIVSNCSITSLSSEAFVGDIILVNNSFYDVNAPYALLSAKGTASGNREYAVTRVAVTASETGGVVSSVHYTQNFAADNLYDYTNGAYVSPSAVVHGNIYKNITGDDIFITARIRNRLNNDSPAAIQVLVGPTAGVSRALPVLSVPSSSIRDQSVSFRVKAGWYFKIVASSPSAADVNGVLIS